MEPRTGETIKSHYVDARVHVHTYTNVYFSTCAIHSLNISKHTLYAEYVHVYQFKTISSKQIPVAGSQDMRNAMHRNTIAQPTAIGLQYLADLPSIANIEFGWVWFFQSVPPVEISDLLSILHSCLGLDIGSKTQIQILHPTVIARNLSVKSRCNVVILTASYSTLMQYARCTVLSQNYPLSAISAAMLSSTLRKSSPSRISCHTNRTQITTFFFLTLEILQCP